MTGQTQQPVDRSSATGDEYAVRWYRPGDDAGIRSLFERELGRVRSGAFFEWKYLDEPYLSHVPVTVAERDGEVVGVQAYLPFPLRAGNRTALALQPADAVVHGDHRRNGLYTRMTELAIDRYADGEPALFFNYPSPGALSAQREMGWESLGDLPVSYRVRRPSRFVADALEGVRGRVLGRAADALARGAFGALDRAAPSADDCTVVRHESVPAETLASLYETHVPERIHLRREPRFYDWWLANPAIEYTSYVAHADGRPVAALVTRRLPDGVLQLREAVPLAPCQPAPLFGRLLSAAFADHPDVAVVKSVGSTLPGHLLRRVGFVADSNRFLADRTTPLRMAVRPLTSDGGAEPLARAVTERSNWHPTFLEVDRD